MSWLIAALTITAISGCDLPRDNPLDPKAYNYLISPDLPILTVNSFHNWEWIPSAHVYYLEMKVEGSFTDIADNVNVIIDGEFSQSLFNNGNMWYNSVNAGLLPGNNIFNLVGVPLYGLVYYGNGSQIETKISNLIRVIEETPIIFEPKGSSINIQPVIFTWDTIKVNFDCSLEFVLNFKPPNENIKIEILRESGLPDSILSYSLNDTLTPAEYTWTISIIDEFKNVSSSREYNFYITQ